jgi:acetyl-CoA decarbonylase/synthase complex subunit delta
MMAMPFICLVGQETWRAKEARASEKEFPLFGPEKERGIIWETLTATALIQAGGDLLVMRHPQAVEEVNKYIETLYS